MPLRCSSTSNESVWVPPSLADNTAAVSRLPLSQHVHNSHLPASASRRFHFLMWHLLQTSSHFVVLVKLNSPIGIFSLMMLVPPSISASEPASFWGSHIAVRSKTFEKGCRTLNPHLSNHNHITYTPMTVDIGPGRPVSIRAGSWLVAACFSDY